jgi:hypothetical protein
MAVQAMVHASLGIVKGFVVANVAKQLILWIQSVSSCVDQSIMG